MIQIKCTGSDELSLGEIKEFQGGLKNRSEKDIDKIILSIRKYGFSFPFFIWKKGKVNYCLDGHGRIKALERLMADGEELPRFPVVYIQAKDSAEAKNKLLRVNSQYGTMSIDSVLEFAGGDVIEFGELELPCGKIFKDEDRDTESGAHGSGFNYVEQFGVIVICSGESEQETIFNMLQGQGYNVRVVKT